MVTILIPTINRSDRIEKIVKNIKETTKSAYKTLFITEDTDPTYSEVLNRIKANRLINGGQSYVSAINFAYRTTDDPFLFLGSDDIEFTDGWDKLMLAEFSNPDIGIVGAKDNWPISQTGHHGSHLMVRRRYIEEQSGVEDEPDVIYSSQYKHYMCDIETEQTAMKRGAFAMSNAVIHHHHWINGEAKEDETYTLEKRKLEGDRRIYFERRRRFEQYLFEGLFEGKVIPVNKKKLSIVVGSYNAPDVLKDTLNSLVENTYHNFELIIVDDASTNIRTKQIINEFQHPNIKRFLLTEHHYTTAVWNYGVARATGDIVVVANNDITFSKWWDVHILNAFKDKDVYIVNPYQTDDGWPEAYGVHDRAGGINIRGTCYAISKEAKERLFPLPKNLVMWFSDFWLAYKVEKLGKKSVFVKEAIVHNRGSKSSIDYERETRLLWWIVRGDALQFQVMTGIDTTHWLEVAEGKLPYSQL